MMKETKWRSVTRLVIFFSVMPSTTKSVQLPLPGNGALTTIYVNDAKQQ